MRMARRLLALMWAACSAMLAVRVAIAEPVGVNWGRMVAQRILPAMGVDMLMANHIPRVRLFSINSYMLDVFNQSGIELMLAIPNNYLGSYLSDENCTNLMKNEIQRYHDVSNIKYIVIGNEPFSRDMNTSDSAMRFAFPVMQNIQRALTTSGYGGRINISMAHFTDVLTTVLKPSKAEFDSYVKGQILETLQFQHDNGCFFMIHINPVFLVKTLGLDPEFALFDGKSNHTIQDGNISYTNLFDCVYDSFVWALTKAGYGNMEVVVGQIGWPTDGYPFTNADMARRFYASFLPRMKSNVGTPLRPNRPIRSYLYSLIDENRIGIVRGTFQRHWGIYKYDGKPKFPIDFSGNGRNDTWPASAKGIVYLPERWCVFNGDWSDREKVYREFNNACDASDCTSLSYGGSCNGLSESENISYAFNMLYQIKSQTSNDEACTFSGLGSIVTKNGSRGTCLFPIQILASPDETRFGSGLGTMIISSNFFVIFMFLILYGAMVLWWWK